MAQDIYIKFKGDASNLTTTVNRVNTALSGLERNATRATQGLDRIDKSSRRAGVSLKGVASALVAIGSAAAVRGIVGSYLEFERFETVLQTFLGSAENARKELTRMSKLANSLPQDLSDITNAFTIFTRFGLDTTNESLTAFSNIATANAKSLTQLAEAVADGMADEFERFKEFGIKVSKEGDTLVARIGEQQVALANNSTDLIRQIQRLGEEGGMFGGAADANANKLGQAFSNLRGTVNLASVALMDELRPALVRIVNGLTDLISAATPAITVIGQGLGSALSFAADNAQLLTIALAGLGATAIFKGLGAVATMAGAIATRLGLSVPFVARIGTSLLRLAGPIGFAVTAAGALYAGFQQVRDMSIEVGNTTTTVNELIGAGWYTLVTTLTENWKKFTQFLGDATQKVVEYVSERWSAITDSATGVLNWLGENFGSTFNSIIQMAKDLANNMGSVFYLILLSAAEIFKGLPQIFVQVFSSAGRVITDFGSKAVNQLSNIGEAMWIALQAPFTDRTFGEAWEAIASNAFAGFGNTISTEMDNIGASLPNLSDQLEKAFDFKIVDTATESVSEFGRIATKVGNDSIAKGTQFVEDSIIKYREHIAATEKLTAETKDFNNEMGKTPETVETAGESLKDLEKLMNEAGKIFAKYNPMLEMRETLEQELSAMDLLYKQGKISFEDFERTKLQIARRYQRQRMDLQRQEAVEVMRNSGVTNDAILRTYETTYQQIQQAQLGGLQGAIGFTDAMGTVFGELGKQNKKAFELAKRFNIASAIMNTALAATKAFAQGGVLGFVTAAAVIAAGMAQVAAIRAQTYQGRALGGPVMGGDSYLIGENGPEIFTPATSGRVTRNDQIGGGQPVNITFNINAIDSQGIDQVLVNRKSVIQQIISDSMMEAGMRSRF